MIPPMQQPNDRSAKWYISHHGDVLLKLARVRPYESWRASANEAVAPRRTPDGLLEVKFADQPAATPVIIEMESKTSADNRRQVSEDLFLVRLTTGVWPDAILVTLTGPDHTTNDDSLSQSSPGGTSASAVSWKTIRLWELDAEELFALGDVGVVPLIPLTRSTQSVEDMLARCRSEIVQKAPPDKRLELLIVSRILAGYRYNNQQGLLDVLLEERMLTESPEITKIISKSKAEGIALGEIKGTLKTMRQGILDIIEEKFSEPPVDLVAQLSEITDVERLRELQRLVIKSSNLDEFNSRAGL